MESIFSNQQLILIFSKRWKEILLITLIGTILIGASTFLIKPKYKSTAVVYPSNLGKYSEESYTEQMLQILQSRDIADSVIAKFALDRHYGISKDDKHYRAKLYDYFYDFVSIQKTPYESIKISVLDTDPQMAYAIVNAIIDYYDIKVRELHRIKIKEEITVLGAQIADIEAQVKNIRPILEKMLLKSGKNDLKAMIEFSGSFEEITSTSNSKIESKKQMIFPKSFDVSNSIVDFEQISSLGPVFIEHFRLYNEQIRTLAKLKVELEVQKNEYKKEITYANIISHPYIPDKKSTPLRGAIALIGGLLVFLTSVVIISIIDKNKPKVEY